MFLLLMFLTFTTNRWEDGSLIPFSTHSWCIFYITCWKWCYAADVTFLGYFDAPAPGLVTRHSGCWGLRPSHFPQAVWASPHLYIYLFYPPFSLVSIYLPLTKLWDSGRCILNPHQQGHSLNRK